MKTWPQNVARFTIDGIPVDELDQRMMRKFRRIADWTGWTMADHLHQAMEDYTAKCDAEKQLQAKIIIFPV